MESDYIREMLKLVLIMFLIGLMSLFVLQTMFLLLFIPTGILILFKKTNLKYTIIGFLLLVLPIVFLFPLSGVFTLIYGAITSSVIIYCFEYKREVLESQVLLAVSTIVSMVLVFAFFNQVLSIDLIEAFKLLIKNSKDVFTDQQNILSLNQGEIPFDEIYNQLILVLPFLIVLWSTFLSVLNFFLSRRILIVMEYPVVSMKRFEEFSYPRHLIYGVTLGLVLVYFISAVEVINSESLMTNFTLIIFNVFAVQGASVLFYYLDKKKVNIYMKGFILLLLFLLQGMIILSLVGWIDLLFDFRKIHFKVNGD